MTAFYHCGERVRQSSPWSAASLQRLHSHVHAAIRQVGFIELNDGAYSLGIAPTNSHPLSNLNKFLRSKNLSSDDETVTTVEDYFPDLNSEFFCKGLQSLHNLWQRVKVSTLNKYDNYSSSLAVYQLHELSEQPDSCFPMSYLLLLVPF